MGSVAYVFIKVYNYLSHIFSGRKIAIGLLNIANGKFCHRQFLQLARMEIVKYLLHQIVDDRGAADTAAYRIFTYLKETIINVGAIGCSFLIGPDIFFADFNKPAIFAESVKALVDEIPVQAIKDNINPCTFGSLKNLLGEFQSARVKNMLDALRP